MAAWEIRVIDQPPVMIDVAPERNLSEEFAAAQQAAATPVRFWQRKPEVLWAITDEAVIRPEFVMAVVRRKRRKPDAAPTVIGFHQGTNETP